MINTILNLFGLILTWGIWVWLASRRFTPVTNLGISIGDAVAIFPVVFAGRKLLDRQPDVSRAERITTVIHYLLAIFLGAAVMSAVQFALEMPATPIPIPPWLGILLMVVSGIALLLALFNLVLRGSGAPFAIAFTRLVVTDWIYAWTRNPMVLSALAFLVGLGLWLQSGLFLIWILVVFSPAAFMFIKFYEERELEIRFGKDYLDYKEKTPGFIPRKPGREV